MHVLAMMATLAGAALLAAPACNGDREATHLPLSATVMQPAAGGDAARKQTAARFDVIQLEMPKTAAIQAAQQIARATVLAAGAIAPVAEMQSVSVPMEANWNDPQFGGYYAWRVIGDSIPTWGPEYRPSGRTITAGYGTFLSSIQVPLPDPGLTKQADRARDRYLMAERNIESTLARTDSYSGGRLTPNALVSLDFYTRERDRWRAEYTKLTEQAQAGYRPLVQAILEYNNAAYVQPAKSPDGLVLNYRTFNITPDLTKWLTDARSAPLKKITRIPLASRYMIRSGKVPGQIPPNLEPGDRGYERFVSVFSQRVEEVPMSGAEIAARNVGVFTIEPGRWFNGSVLASFKSGPWAAAGQSDATFWGENGILNLLPSRLIVVYEPTVTLNAKAEQLQSVLDLLASTKTLQIGPLAFAMSGDAKATIRTDAAHNIVEIASPPGKAYVVAVINRVLP